MQREIYRATFTAACGLSLLCGVAFAASDKAAYTTAQANQGTAVYASQCASCHGADLKGNIGPALKGTQFEQMAAAQQLTGASLRAVIAQAMPKNNPGGLSAAQYDQVTAYILQQNGYSAGSSPLSAKSPQAQMLSLSNLPANGH